MVYFYKDGQGFAIVCEDNIISKKRIIKIYIPGIKTYDKSYIFDNLNQSDVVIRGFYDWIFSSNPGDIYENLINDLGNHGLTKRFLLIRYELPTQLHKIISVESLTNFITSINLVDTYYEMFLTRRKSGDGIYETHLSKSVNKEIIFKLVHLNNTLNLRMVLPGIICKNFRKLIKRLDDKYTITSIKNDFYFKMSTLLIYFKKKKLLKD